MSSSTQEFARRLRQLRKRAGFTQEELAERSELSRNYIGLLELEKREPSLSSLLSLSAALSCSLNDLVGMPERSVVAEETSIYRTRSLETRKRELLEEVHGCTPVELDLIAEVVGICVRLAGRRK